MNATTVSEKCVRIDWRDRGRPKYRTCTLTELREIAAANTNAGPDVNYTVDVPGGSIWHADGRTNWSDPAMRGASRILWISGDLNDLASIAEEMQAGKTFPEIHESA